MSNTVLDGVSICDIIKTCHTSNVSRLKFGDFEVTFWQGPNEIIEECEVVNEPLGGGPVSMELTTEQKQIMDEAELTDLMTLDPVGWEQHQIDRLVHQNRSLDGRSGA